MQFLSLQEADRTPPTSNAVPYTQRNDLKKLGMTLGYQEEWSPKQLTETAVPLSILSCKGHGSQHSSTEKFPIPTDCQPGAPKKGGLQNSLQTAKKLNNGLIHVIIFVLQPSL